MVQISDSDLYYLNECMSIALSDKTQPDLRNAAEAVASAILNGTSGNSLQSEVIAILTNEELYSAIPYVDKILSLKPDGCN